VAHFGASESRKPIRSWQYVVFGIAPGNFAFHKRVSVRGFSCVVDRRDSLACPDSPIARWSALDWRELDQWKRDKSWRPALRFRAALWFSSRSKTVRSQGRFSLGRILDLHKQELPILDLSSRRHQTLAPLGACSQRMSGMQPQMVGPLPVLHPDIGRDMAESDSPLCSLQQTAETGSACELGPRLQSFPQGSAIDKDTKLQSSVFLRRGGNR
jgi:hypothetical protein